MVKLNAHYDGKVIVPDEPLSLAPNQKLRISIEPIDSPALPRADWQSLVGIAKGAPGKPHDPGADEDALWEKGSIR